MSLLIRREHVINAVIKHDKIGNIALLKLAYETDHFLSSDIAEFAKIRDTSRDAVL